MRRRLHNPEPYPRTAPVRRFARSGGSCTWPSDSAQFEVTFVLRCQMNCVLGFFTSSTLPDKFRAVRTFLHDVFFRGFANDLGRIRRVSIHRAAFHVPSNRTPPLPRPSLRRRSSASFPRSFYSATVPRLFFSAPYSHPRALETGCSCPAPVWYRRVTEIAVGTKKKVRLGSCIAH